jgi:2-polyprenyl-6-methoxyphenol hydroxylase-like FAD-dependent oxidoreductase
MALTFALTRFWAGAGGPNAPVRAFASITTHGWAYDTHAVVATLSLAPHASLQPPNTTAYQRSLPTRQIAFLLLSLTESSMVWSTKPALAAAPRICGPLYTHGLGQRRLFQSSFPTHERAGLRTIKSSRPSTNFTSSALRHSHPRSWRGHSGRKSSTRWSRSRQL